VRLWWRRRTDEDFRREIDSHLAIETDRLVSEGLRPDEARAAAFRSFGNVTRAQEHFYESRRIMWLDDACGDIRYALRTLAKNPAFALVAILTIAIGIGATTAIFSVVNALLLKPLPYPDSDRLVRLIVNVPPGQSARGGPRRVAGGISIAELAELRSRMKTVSQIGMYGPALMTLTSGQEAVRLEGMRMSPSIWQALGARPVLGRIFDAGEAAPAAEPVVVLSYASWQRLFHGDPNILGHRLVLEDNILLMLGNKRFSAQYAVIGVMPEGFEFPDRQAQFWIPVSSSGPGGGAMLARLTDGLSIQTASAEVNLILRELRPQQTGMRYEVAREQDELVGPVKQPLLVLLAAVGFVLLIVCVNVANLLLARTVVRQREIAIRTALGSGRGRLIRQFLTESAMLSLLGGTGGIALAYAGIHLLRRLGATLSRMDLGNLISFPRLNEIGIDASVLLFALGTSVVTSFLFGLTPIVGHANANQINALKQRTGASVRTGRKSALVIAEIAMAMMLLIGGGLLIHSFIKLSAVNPGYNPSNVLTFQLAFPGGRYSVPQLKDFAEKLVAELEATPGVQSAAYAHQMPMVALRQSAFFRRTPAPPEHRIPGPSAEDARFVSRDYFKVLGIPIKAGRGFDAHDRAGQPRVVVINESLARRDFPGENPIGKSAYLGLDSEPWQIVGIAEDVRQFRFDRKPEPQVFVDFRQWPGTSLIGDVPQYFAVRTQGDPTSLTSDVRGVVRKLDAQAGLYNIAPLEQLVSNSMSRSRLYAVLLGIFAGVSLVLAAIGIYGIMAYSVVQRTREIGIRMALGAKPAEVLGLVLRQSMWLTAAGIILGCIGAAAVTRYLEGMLFDIKPLDPLTVVSVTMLFISVAALASYAPAYSATKVDPQIALRCD
jgi:putative ABC transport system permease protein